MDGDGTPGATICQHPVLAAVKGLYGYYRCAGPDACGLFFHLQLTYAHTPRDFRAMAHWFAKAGGPPEPGDRFVALAAELDPPPGAYDAPAETAETAPQEAAA